LFTANIVALFALLHHLPKGNGKLLAGGGPSDPVQGPLECPGRHTLGRAHILGCSGKTATVVKTMRLCLDFEH